MLLLGRDATAPNTTIIGWSRFDYSMLLLGRGVTAPNILLLLIGRAPIIVCYCLVAVQLLRYFVIYSTNCNIYKKFK
jgi:uncharacterized membrane protein YuzA (DUF378 family)